MNTRVTILDLGSHIQPGDTVRELCPSCRGGNSGEKSLSITKAEDGTLVWQCFRDKCTERGGTSESVATHVSQVTIEKPRKVFSGTTKRLSPEWLAEINSMWGIEDPPYWYYTPEYGGRIAMSIRGPKYTHRGWVLRDISGKARAKALTYIDPQEETLSWYKTHKDKPTVLVEDIPSAVRASRYVNAIALLGTAIGLGKALEIHAHATRPVVIALDQDATAKAFQHQNRYGLLWGSTKVLPLPKDLKDMQEEELCQILTGSE